MCFTYGNQKTITDKIFYTLLNTNDLLKTTTTDTMKVWLYFINKNKLSIVWTCLKLFEWPDYTWHQFCASVQLGKKLINSKTMPMYVHVEVI